MIKLLTFIYRKVCGVGEVSASPKSNEIIYSVDREKAILKLARQHFEAKKRLRV